MYLWRGRAFVPALPAAGFLVEQPPTSYPIPVDKEIFLNYSVR